MSTMSAKSEFLMSGLFVGLEQVSHNRSIFMSIFYDIFYFLRS